MSVQTHVYPVDDLRDHEMTELCWCKPEVLVDEVEDIVVHNSMDGREAYETGDRLPH